MHVGYSIWRNRLVLKLILHRLHMYGNHFPLTEILRHFVSGDVVHKRKWFEANSKQIINLSDIYYIDGGGHIHVL